MGLPKRGSAGLRSIAWLRHIVVAQTPGLNGESTIKRNLVQERRNTECLSNDRIHMDYE